MNHVRTFQRTTYISAGLICFLIGLAIRPDMLRQTLVVMLLAGFALKRAGIYRSSVVWAICLVMLLLGLARGTAYRNNVARYDRYVGRRVVLSGVVRDDPVYDSRSRLDFRVHKVHIGSERLVGQVRVKTFGGTVRRGDLVRMNGTLRDGFGNYQASMYFATVQRMAASPSPLEKIRRTFFAAVFSVLPDLPASLGLGFLVGLHAALPEEFEEQLRVAGLTHIVVASGYNLTVLVRLSRRLLARHSKFQALTGSLALIALAITLTGASPSMVRASVVTVLSLWAWYYGRRFQPVLILLLGASITAGFNPLYLWSDLGWWLSFLAFAGVLLVGPLITARFWRRTSPSLVVQIAIETCSAQLLTLPLTLMMFGKLSLVALIANVAVVPFIPLAMAATMIAGVAGLTLPLTFAAWLAIPARLLMEYVVGVVRFTSAPSWAAIEVPLPVVGMLLCYGCCIGLLIVLGKRTGFRFRAAPSIVE